MEDKTIKKGIRRKVVVSILVVGILPLLFGLYLTYLDGTTTRRNSIGASFQEMAKETANKIDMIIKKEVVDAQRLAIIPDIRNIIKNKNYEKEEVNNYLKRFIGFDDEREVNSLIIVNAKGGHVISLGEVAKKSYGQEKWFRDAFNNGEGRIYVDDLKFDDALGMPLMSIAVIKYRIDKLLEVINNVKIENTGHANLVDSSGTIIMCPIFPLRSHHISAELLSIMSKGNTGWSEVEDDAHGGKNSIIGFAPVEST